MVEPSGFYLDKHLVFINSRGRLLPKSSRLFLIFVDKIEVLFAIL